MHNKHGYLFGHVTFEICSVIQAGRPTNRPSFYRGSKPDFKIWTERFCCLELFIENLILTLNLIDQLSIFIGCDCIGFEGKGGGLSLGGADAPPAGSWIPCPLGGLSLPRAVWNQKSL